MGGWKCFVHITIQSREISQTFLEYFKLENPNVIRMPYSRHLGKQPVEMWDVNGNSNHRKPQTDKQSQTLWKHMGFTIQIRSRAGCQFPKAKGNMKIKKSDSAEPDEG